MSKPTTARILAGAAAAALAVGLATAASPAGATVGRASSVTTCAVSWGSLPRSATTATTSVGALTNVRAGRHTCFDRLVLDVANARGAGYDVRYVSAVYADGSGALVPLRGGAKLQVIARTPAYDAAGQATYRPARSAELVDVAGFSTFRQVAWAGSFEGQSTIGLGVRARLPFRAFTLVDEGRTRLVIDVAHRW